MARITVVGSVNLDLVAKAPRLPRPGETVTDASFARHPGGKGANQALAARRMDAVVRFVGRTGADPEAELAMALLREAGVDLAECRQLSDSHTGVALIVVDEDGENQIVVAPGANRKLAPEDVRMETSDAVICQLEIPVETVAEAMTRASFAVLNAAPARALPPPVLANCDVVIVNQTEADFYGGALQDIPLVITTLGADGAVATKAGREVARAPSPKVDVVDTVGAGDTFVGAFVVALADGAELPAALRIGCVAGALATTVPGAQPSIPTRSAVAAFEGQR